jgi:hypothetical protein
VLEATQAHTGSTVDRTNANARQRPGPGPLVAYPSSPNDGTQGKLTWSITTTGTASCGSSFAHDQPKGRNRAVQCLCGEGDQGVLRSTARYRAAEHRDVCRWPRRTAPSRLSVRIRELRTGRTSQWRRLLRVGRIRVSRSAPAAAPLIVPPAQASVSTRQWSAGRTTGLPTSSGGGLCWPPRGPGTPLTARHPGNPREHPATHRVSRLCPCARTQRTISRPKMNAEASVESGVRSDPQPARARLCATAGGWRPEKVQPILLWAGHVSSAGWCGRRD